MTDLTVDSHLAIFLELSRSFLVVDKKFALMSRNWMEFSACSGKLYVGVVGDENDRLNLLLV